MKNLMMTVCCAIGVAAAGLSAQSGTMEKGKMDKGMKSGTVMLTGCVADGTSGHYMLTNAMMSGGMKGKMKDEPMSYNLMGGDLKAHVGHKVEVTGTMSDKMMKDGKMDKDKDKMDKDKMDKMSGEMHGVNVKSVKMISATCS